MLSSSLETKHGGKTEMAPATEAIIEVGGRYIYCVANAGERVSLGRIGIGGNEVYTIPYNSICAVVHNHLAQSHQSDEREVVMALAMTHQKVVDAAWERWGTVLPLSWGTIINGGSGEDSEEEVSKWLKSEYEALKRKIEKVRGKAEYVVQVFWDPRVIAQYLVSTSIRTLDDEIKTMPRGLAYMYRQKLENLLKKEMETKADEFFQDFYNRIRKHTYDIRVEKTKQAEQGLQMIMNLSCLVNKDRYTELGRELDKINQMEGFSIRFTGPWPPYSFVAAA